MSARMQRFAWDVYHGIENSWAAFRRAFYDDPLPIVGLIWLWVLALILWLPR